MSPQTSRFFSKLKLTPKIRSNSEADSLLDGTDSLTIPQSSHSVPRLVDDASNFEKILLQSGCINPEGVCPHGSTGFQDLVAQDLSEEERAKVHHNARLNAVNHSWVCLSEDNDENLCTDFEHHDFENIVQKVTPTINRVSTVGDQFLNLLKYSDIVDILIEEFGSLSDPTSEEKLLLETDGCILQRVAIVGVIHLTTHRLTFHASLLSPSSDYGNIMGIIKSGPAVMHRKGWRIKRRVWLELSHDMICIYASSKEEERTRPLSTLLLSFVKDIVPFNSQCPRIVQLTLVAFAKSPNDYAEFETEESAADWRRELMGALFNYRHFRKESLSSSMEGRRRIRLNFPLTTIRDIRHIKDLGFSSLKSFHVWVTPSDERCELRDFTIGPFESFPLWECLEDIIANAKQRTFSGLDPSMQVVIDYGPYNFYEAEQQPFNYSTELSTTEEQSVRFALGYNLDSKIWVTRARISASWGYFAIDEHLLGFWSKNLTQKDVHYRIPISLIRYALPFRIKWVNIDGMKLRIEGKAEYRFVFKSSDIRDEALRRVQDAIDMHRSRTPAIFTSRQQFKGSPQTPQTFANLPLTSSPTSSSSLLSEAQSLSEKETGLVESSEKFASRRKSDLFSPLSRSIAATSAAGSGVPQEFRSQIPKVLNLPREVLLTRQFFHFICLTIGSRGDIQPYIALGLRLMKEGHKVTIVTHNEYRDWIVGFGLGHRPAGGDPVALMKLSVDHKMFSPDFFKESLTKFRPWLEQLLIDAWGACQDADILLESPSAMAGVHIAEALKVPYMRCFTMPWTKTTAFPHAFLSSPVDAPMFNSASYVLFNNVIWAATSGQINKWRRQVLSLNNTDMGHMAQSRITFIYNFSKAVVPKSLDWPDTTIISGYWFLDRSDQGWEAPQDLLDFMDKAREDGKPIVYIGFGSITVPHPNKVTARIVDAVLRSDIRAVITKGWSGRMSKKSGDITPPELPPECYFMDSVPHDWMFPRIDAALHHGGAGTTGASLRAGVPTLIKPWFGDQFFWASRVHNLGAGLRVSSLRVEVLAKALETATKNPEMKAKASVVGQKIRKEDGVHTAIYEIYKYLYHAHRDYSLSH